MPHPCGSALLLFGIGWHSYAESLPIIFGVRYIFAIKFPTLLAEREIIANASYGSICQFFSLFQSIGCGVVPRGGGGVGGKSSVFPGKAAAAGGKKDAPGGKKDAPGGKKDAALCGKSPSTLREKCRMFPEKAPALSGESGSAVCSRRQRFRQVPYPWSAECPAPPASIRQMPFEPRRGEFRPPPLEPPPFWFVFLRGSEEK